MFTLNKKYPFFYLLRIKTTGGKKSKLILEVEIHLHQEVKSMVLLQEKLMDKLAWLSEFGKDEKGGVSRLLYSNEWLSAQNGLKTWMEEEGLEASFDEVGNLFGTLTGEIEDEIILTGSHVDTVTNGGTLDGQLGIVAGIIALAYLKETYGKPKRTLEVVSMAEEEGSRFPFAFWGSKNIVGMASNDKVADIKDFDHIPFTKAMNDCGFRFKEDDGQMRSNLKAFLELHIEQGGVLEAEQKSVGVVHNIVGQRRFTIQLDGEANHAGTTPMSYRRDAVYAASDMIYELVTLAKKFGEPLVATVGKIEALPNIVNVVPGKVIFTIDVRHTEKSSLVAFTDEMTSLLEQIAKKHEVELAIDMWMDASPIPMDEELVTVIKNQCDELNLNYKVMHSGAGHDSQIFAPYVPTAMLFVPSHKGISHNPKEYTKPEDLYEGTKALIGALYELAYK